jgi:CRISPR-associated protein Csd1
VELLRSAPQDVPELQAVFTFLANATSREACAKNLAEKGGFASNDLFCFEVAGEMLADIEELQTWWRTQREEADEGSLPMQCLVCGEFRVSARLHNSFQIRGASTSGVPLVSFNAGAFEKYGLSGNDNAPVCTGCMTAYTEALRRLTRAQYETPSGRKLRPLSTVLNGDTTAVYWAEGQSELPALLSAMNTDPKSIRELLDSPRKGSEFLLKDTSGFYCLILTGAQGRASVRRLHVDTVAAVSRNLLLYFRAIQTGGSSEHVPMPLSALLRSLVFKGELERLPSDLGVELWMTALFGLPLSPAFLAAVVTRIRVEQQDLQQGIWKVGRQRAALLQLYFISNRFDCTGNRRGENDSIEDLRMGLNHDIDDRAYVFGRIFATAERMQLLAQSQGLNRTLVDRFFAMASVRPQTVYAQLLSQYQYHYRKAMRDIPGVAKKANDLWLELQSKLDARGAFGKSFDFADQARFGLGYYHQKQDFVDQAMAAKAAREALALHDAEAITSTTDSNEETTA